MNIFHKQSGFTLAETMIAVGIFSMVMVIGTGAILNANRTHKKVQTQRAIIDSLSFALEDIGRNLRTGYDYHCGTTSSGGTPLDCNTKETSLAYKTSQQDSSSSEESIDWFVIYEISTRVENDNIGIATQTENRGTSINNFKKKYALGKAHNAGETLLQREVESITPPEVEIDINKSGFVVIGAPKGDGLQPRVLITLAGIVRDREVSTPFFIQTTVSQRVPDR
ncbi:MAG: prepilin-type N-terminal cleavage/methylation domain-containing protein [Flavobacteriaceae bacterium]|jgi:prepilin-type N-terminal cleavage/methylation domain-containing protein